MSSSRSWDVYSIQQYVIKFVGIAAAWWFSPGSLASSINKTDRHNITEILLKVALDTMTLTLTLDVSKSVFSAIETQYLINYAIYQSKNSVIKCVIVFNVHYEMSFMYMIT